MLDDAELRQVTEALMPLVAAMAREFIDTAVRKALGATYVSGVIASVAGADAVITPDDNPAGSVPATVTDAGSQIVGARVVIRCGAPGTSFIQGVIP